MMMIRPLSPAEYPLLCEFLYQAIFIPDGVEPPPREIIEQPELQVYIENFGTQADDHALCAEADGKVVGAVWVRIMDDYGHLDDDTPSLAISLLPEYRGKGIGTALLREMLGLLRDAGYAQVSLSVQKENFAVRMYRKAGFNVIADHGEEYLMCCEF